jgi:nucleoside-diphosphate-sugar epimerase
MNVLVLGGTRYVGLRLVAELVRRGHTVAVLNRGKSEADLPAGVARLQADRRQDDQVRAALAGRDFDTIVDVSGYSASGVRLFADLYRDRLRSYVFVSTAGVYAPWDKIPITEDFPLDRRPDLGPYIGEKVKAEDALMDAWRDARFPVTIVRPPVIFGPYEYLWERAPGIFARLDQRRPIPLRGSPASYTCIADVDDMARLMANALDTDVARGQAYNCAFRYAVTAEYVIRYAAGLVGVEPRIRELSREDAAALRGNLPPLGGDRLNLLSIAKAQRDLGDWQQATIESCLEACWQDYQTRIRGKVPFDFSAEDPWR